MQRIASCLWFDGRAEEAAAFYTSIFPRSSVDTVVRHQGAVLTVAFTLDGVEYLALNGGPQYPFTPAHSLMVRCETQAEIDHYWERLAEGGAHHVCGWLYDKFGLSWQIVPAHLESLLKDPHKAERVMAAVMTMTKLDIAKLEQAAQT